MWPDDLLALPTNAKAMEVLNGGYKPVLSSNKLYVSCQTCRRLKDGEAGRLTPVDCAVAHSVVAPAHRHKRKSPPHSCDRIVTSGDHVLGEPITSVRRPRVPQPQEGHTQRTGTIMTMSSRDRMILCIALQVTACQTKLRPCSLIHAMLYEGGESIN